MRLCSKPERFALTKPALAPSVSANSYFETSFRPTLAENFPEVARKESFYLRVSSGSRQICTFGAWLTEPGLSSIPAFMRQLHSKRLSDKSQVRNIIDFVTHFSIFRGKAFCRGVQPTRRIKNPVPSTSGTGFSWFNERLYPTLVFDELGNDGQLGVVTHIGIISRPQANQPYERG